MKAIIFLILLLPMIAMAGQDKEYVCHNDEITIYVAEPSLTAHLDHGDILGECEDGYFDESYEDEATEGEKPEKVKTGRISWKQIK